MQCNLLSSRLRWRWNAFRGLDKFYFAFSGVIINIQAYFIDIPDVAAGNTGSGFLINCFLRPEVPVEIRNCGLIDIKRAYSVNAWSD